MELNDLNTIRANVDAFRLYLEDRTGRPSNEMVYPPKLIYFYLRMFGDQATYEYLKDDTNTDEDFTSVLSCVELEKIDVVECPCAPSSGCTWLRSVHPLPKMIDGKPKSVTLIKPKGSKATNSNFIFDFIDWERFPDMLKGRNQAQSKQLYYTLLTTTGTKSQHLYIYTNSEFSNLKAVRVSAIFRDHLEYCEFPQCGGSIINTCNPLDEEFVINKNIKARVFDLTYNALRKVKVLSPGADVINNDNPDAQINVQNT